MKWSCSVVYNSLWSHVLKPTRLLHPWDFPGKSTGVGCHCLLRTISWSLLKLMSIESVSHSTILSSVTPFSSCLQSFPASGSFPMRTLHIRWPKYCYLPRILQSAMLEEVPCGMEFLVVEDHFLHSHFIYLAWAGCYACWQPKLWYLGSTFHRKCAPLLHWFWIL